jgi:hypothetical protein
MKTEQAPICAPGVQEHSLCGLAPDAYESGDWDRPVVFAEAGQHVTCEQCRATLTYARKNFSRWVYRPTPA